ncbi:putative phosphatase regulatory subunit-domain-containing protein [Podospora fimiseda]|uniref:Phosphatase regulatory subunit-domain-containing protein n=1 Tax=Podospora fimiseda TaxID=252190 RepID=A0AAN7BG78_9PEZI|nr:putative phosphatase regulatory subunit-domain-containing protein [Podospora fimiseda]
MPYTPPSHRSPASSVPPSPDGSRRPSFHHSPSLRPVLPRSASYLTKQRRTQPAQRPASEPSPESTSEDLAAMAISPSVRQSPPPVTGEGRMPNGAIISPPESSDDDDMPQIRTESHVRKIENLKELQVAVSQIPQPGLASPTEVAEADKKSADAADLLVLPQQSTAIAAGMHHSLSTGSLDGLALGGSRKFSHTRSHTEPHIVLSKSANSSVAGSDDEDDGERLRKPQMVRKKSGELVRPALRPSSRRRPSSMPGTPTFSKAVHFDSHLEHVRHFLQVDRPLAVSAGSSPIDHYDSDSEYPFSAADRTATRATSFEWEILMRSFPVETPARKAQTVRLERIWLSNDQKTLVGSVAVANLAFQKHVTCRFTLDYWKTTSEVVGEYAGNIQPVDTPYPQDRFNFSIKLSDLANLETKTLYFCIRYNVNGQEHWDSNNGANFQVDFKKKVTSQSGKGGARTATGLPKSNRRPSAPILQRPKPKSGDSDRFGAGSKFDFESIDDYLGDNRLGGVRLKGVKSSANLPSDNLSSRLSAPSGQAFANRYDFGTSLTHAIQTAKDQMTNKSDGGLYMKPLRRLPVTATLNTKLATADNNTKPVEKPIQEAPKVKPAPAASTAPAVGQPSSIPGTDSPGTSIASASYEEIVNKYCFFGTKQTSPVHKDDSTTRPARYDGVDDGFRTHNSSSSTSSYEGSPVQMGNYRHAHSGTQHHSLYHRDPNPYFQHIPSSFGPMGASPAESPIMGFPVKRSPSPAKNQAAVQPATGQQNGFSSSSPPTAGNFAPFAGTSPNEYSYQHMHDRFPFSGADAHSSTAIRG